MIVKSYSVTSVISNSATTGFGVTSTTGVITGTAPKSFSLVIFVTLVALPGTKPDLVTPVKLRYFLISATFMI